MIEVLPLYASHKGDYTHVPRRDRAEGEFNFGLADLSSLIQLGRGGGRVPNNFIRGGASPTRSNPLPCYIVKNLFMLSVRISSY